MKRDKKRTPRETTLKIRCTKSLLKFIELQQKTFFYKGFSISDIIHEAVAIKANQELYDKPEIISGDKRNKIHNDIIQSI